MFSFNVFVIFRYMPRSGTDGTFDSYNFHFLKNFHTVSMMAMLICIPTNCVQVLPFFLISSSTFVICILFDDSHSDRCEVIFHYDFDLHLSGMWLSGGGSSGMHLTYFGILIIFSCACCPFVILLWRNVFSGLLLFLISGLFLTLCCMSYL